MTFSGQNIAAPSGFERPEFIVRPIVVTDAELDYEAVMESREFLRTWEQSTWPEDDFTVEANRDDMVKLEQRHNSGESFAYTVLSPDQTSCLGCVYIFSPQAGWFAGDVTACGDATWADVDSLIFFWVRKSHVESGTDARLLGELLSWFDSDWSFGAPVVVTNEQFEQQVTMIETAGLHRRFEIKLPKDPGRYFAYA